MNIEKIKGEVTGKWRWVLSTLGISVPDDVLKHGPCPICGPGTNSHRFRFDDKDGAGTWICSQCGAGDGWMLLEKIFNIGFVQAVEKVDRLTLIGVETSPPPKPVDDGSKKNALNKLWKESVPLTGNGPVCKYLHSRGLVLTPMNVRYCSGCYHSEMGTNIPAMISKIHDSAGNPVGLHRTYLQDTGGHPKKKLMPSAISLVGSAVRLFSPNDKLFKENEGILGIAEGVETALSTSQSFGVATWACLSTAIMAGFKPPPPYKHIKIYGDNDIHFVGQVAAYELAKRLHKEGYEVDVHIPFMRGEDWNDVLRRTTGIERETGAELDRGVQSSCRDEEGENPINF